MKAGDSFGGCQILSECGSGAYGTVYLCRDALGRTVAMKVFRMKWEEERPLKGLQRYVSLQEPHPALLRIYHFGVEDGLLYYVMEAADNAKESREGEYIADSLGWRLVQRGAISLGESLSICHRLLDALEQLHSMKIVHRDVKPENILFVNGEPKLGDFDFLCDYTQSASLAGTIGFLPPEVMSQKGKLKSPAVDLYALGKIFYCCVTGKSAMSYPDIPQEMPLEKMQLVCYPLTKLCSKDPRDRVRSAEEFRRVLPLDLENAGSSPWRRIWTGLLLRPKLRRAVLALAALFICLTCLCGWWFGQRMVRFRAERAAALRAESDRLAFLRELAPLLEPDLTSEQRETFYAGVEAGEESIVQKDEVALRENLASLQEQLHSCAVEKIPAPLQGFEFTEENLLENGRSFGRLHSPLLRTGLSPAEWKALQERLTEETKRLIPNYGLTPHAGEGFHVDYNRPIDLDFLPPGEGIPYPFWMMSKNVTIGTFATFCGYRRDVNDDSSDATYLNFNDVLFFCRKLTEYFQKSYLLLPGYVIRPPNVEEVEWARVFQARGGLEQRVRLEEPEPLDAPLVVLPSLNSYEFARMEGTDGEAARRVVPMYPDLSASWHYRLRLVLAPGEADYWKNAWHLSNPMKTFKRNGRRYACQIEAILSKTASDLVKLADSFGARLVEPESFSEWEELVRITGIPSDWEVLLGIHWKEDAWRYLSSGKAVSWEELSKLPKPVQGMECLVGQWGTCATIQDAHLHSILFFEWESEEAWNRRGEGWQSGTAGIVEESFELDGKRFLLVHSPVNAQGLDELCALAGCVPAQLQDKELRAKVLARYADFPHRVFIGAQRYFDNWRWRDGTEEKLVFTAENREEGRVLPMLERVAIEGGRLTHCLTAEFFLAEW